MFKCYEGHLFDEPKIIKEPHGELLAHCPVCGDSFEEAERCEICGEYFRPDELYDGVCNDCINEYRYDWATCIRFADKEKVKTEIEINSVLALLYSPEEIEQILVEHFTKKRRSTYISSDADMEIVKRETDCIEFINDDRYWFAGMILDERNESNV